MNSEKSFKYSLTILALFIIMILMHILQAFIRYDFSVFYTSTSLVILILINFSIYHAVIGLKDKNSVKKIIGLILNAGYLILFISLITITVVDLYNVNK